MSHSERKILLRTPSTFMFGAPHYGPLDEKYYPSFDTFDEAHDWLRNKHIEDPKGWPKERITYDEYGVEMRWPNIIVTENKEVTHEVCDKCLGDGIVRIIEV